MRDKLEQALKSRFDSKERQVVFWYDTNEEFGDDFAVIELPGVEKVELRRNEFTIKNRVLREEPDRHFLIYARGPQPKDVENWLLDVLLSNAVFRTDKVQMWLSELGLPTPFAGLLEEHANFFRSNSRYNELKKAIKHDDGRAQIQLKMLSACLGVHADLEKVVEALFGQLARGDDALETSLSLLERCNLTPYLWAQLEERFGYKSPDPNIADFALELFRSSYSMDLGEGAALGTEAQVCFKRWKDSRVSEGAFEKLSAEFAEALDIKKDLERREFRVLIQLDQFEAIDRYILSALVNEVAQQTVSDNEVERWIRLRRATHWYKDFAPIYEAIQAASSLFSELSQTSLEIASFDDGLKLYADRWFKIDQLYRSFVYNADQAKQATSLLAELSSQVENRYSNQFLLTLNDNWQEHVDATSHWSTATVPMQTDFYRHKVRHLRQNKQKVCVIISDAMRYEVGEELQRHIRALDRFDAELEPALSVIPSYTQLGMAALLPHNTLEITEDSTVLVDGFAASGLSNRSKILENGGGGDRTIALKFEELIGMVKDDARVLIRDHDIVYVYHDRIDAIGDKPGTERQVFEAVDETFEDLVSAVRKLMSANASRVLITADHGFLFQAQKIDESDYASKGVTGSEPTFFNRRFALGRGLHSNQSASKFTSEALGLAGDLEIQIPKSINRLRRKGSGSRFVHGGAALQEIVIPILSVSKSRASDVERVEVNILTSAGQQITTNQLGVKLYQCDAVDEKIQPRFLKVGLYSADGTLLSDEQMVEFNAASTDPRDREVSVRLLLSKKSDDFNNQQVHLRLLEQHKQTSAFKEYKSVSYTLRRRHTDFDF